MSLLEVVISSALALFLLGVAIRLLVSSLSISTASAARVELHQRAMVVSEKVLADLSLSSRGGVAFLDTASALTIHQRDRASSLPSWSPEVVIYQCVPPELRRLTTARPDVGPRAYRPNTPEQWQSLMAAPQHETYKTSGVSGMSANLGEGPLIQLTLEVHRGELALTCRRALYLRQGN